MAKTKNKPAVLKNVQGFRICQVLGGKNSTPTNEIAICRGKKEIKKFSVKEMVECEAECVRLAEKARVEHAK